MTMLELDCAEANKNLNDLKGETIGLKRLNDSLTREKAQIER